MSARSSQGNCALRRACRDAPAVRLTCHTRRNPGFDIWPRRPPFPCPPGCVRESTRSRSNEDARRITSCSRRWSDMRTTRSRCAVSSRRHWRLTRRSSGPARCAARMSCMHGSNARPAVQVPHGRSRGKGSLFGAVSAIGSAVEALAAHPLLERRVNGGLRTRACTGTGRNDAGSLRLTERGCLLRSSNASA